MQRRSCPAACKIVVPGAGIEPMSTALARQILNHWTTREVPSDWLLMSEMGFFLLEPYSDEIECSEHHVCVMKPCSSSPMASSSLVPSIPCCEFTSWIHPWTYVFLKVSSLHFTPLQPFYLLVFPGGASGKEPTCQCRRFKRHEFDPWVWKIPWRRSAQPTPVFLPGESHGQRSLAGYSPRTCKELDMIRTT